MKYHAHSQHYATDNPERAHDSGCHRKARPIFVIDAAGRIVGGYWVELTDDAKRELYTAERNRKKEPVDIEIVWPAGWLRHDDGRGYAAIEMDAWKARRAA